MHFRCTCGNTIHDITDQLSYKASILADQDAFDFNDEIERYVSDETLDAKACMNRIMLIWNEYLGRKIYQCHQCGRIIIEDRSGEMYFFAPEFATEGMVGKRLLTSAKAENWKGYLHGEWSEKTPDWREHQGYIDVYTNDEAFPGWQDFDSREELEKEYYALFEKLRDAGRIRSASLKIGRERVHDWPPRPQ
ncbi:MAG: hypothetical protein K2K19_04625 [Acetatifactor sp.]|nr:hypothetical protein [Acetatifactor sp.]